MYKKALLTLVFLVTTLQFSTIFAYTKAEFVKVTPVLENNLSTAESKYDDKCNSTLGKAYRKLNSCFDDLCTAGNNSITDARTALYNFNYIVNSINYDTETDLLSRANTFYGIADKAIINAQNVTSRIEYTNCSNDSYTTGDFGNPSTTTGNYSSSYVNESDVNTDNYIENNTEDNGTVWYDPTTWFNDNTNMSVDDVQNNNTVINNYSKDVVIAEENASTALVKREELDSIDTQIRELETSIQEKESVIPGSTTTDEQKALDSLKTQKVTLEQNFTTDDQTVLAEYDKAEANYNTAKKLASEGKVLKPTSISAEDLTPTSISAEDLTPTSISAEDLTPTSISAEDLTPTSISAEDLTPTSISAEDLTPTSISAEDLTPTTETVSSLGSTIDIFEGNELINEVRTAETNAISKVEATQKEVDKVKKNAQEEVDKVKKKAQEEADKKVKTAQEKADNAKKKAQNCIDKNSYACRILETNAQTAQEEVDKVKKKAQEEADKVKKKAQEEADKKVKTAQEKADSAKSDMLKKQKKVIKEENDECDKITMDYDKKVKDYKEKEKNVINAEKALTDAKKTAENICNAGNNSEACKTAQKNVVEKEGSLNKAKIAKDKAEADKKIAGNDPKVTEAKNQKAINDQLTANRLIKEQKDNIKKAEDNEDKICSKSPKSQKCSNAKENTKSVKNTAKTAIDKAQKKANESKVDAAQSVLDNPDSSAKDKSVASKTIVNDALKKQNAACNSDSGGSACSAAKAKYEKALTDAKELKEAYLETSAAKKDITTRVFTIHVNKITPGMKIKGGSLEETVNFALGTIIRNLMIGLGSLSILIMTVGAGYIVLHNGQDELLNKGKSIFMSGIYAMIVALTSYYLITIVRYLLYH